MHEKLNCAAPVAQLDADLPPLPPSLDAVRAYFRGEVELLTPGDEYYTAEQYRQGQREVAMQYVERIRHLEREAGLQALVADQLKARVAAADAHIERLERELAKDRAAWLAEMKTDAELDRQVSAQSIGDDPKFCALFEEYDDAVSASGIEHARKALIACIDGRTAAAVQHIDDNEEFQRALGSLIAAAVLAKGPEEVPLEKMTRLFDSIEAWGGRTAGTASEAAPPVAPKGPFADYSAEEIEAYAREYVAPYVERIRHLERELEERVDSSNTTGGCGRCPRDTPYGPATCGKCLEAEECAKQPAQSIDTPEFVTLEAAYVKALYEYPDAPSQKRADAITAARRALIAYIDGRTAGTASEAAPDAEATLVWLEWQPVTRAGQVKKGSKLRFKIGDKTYSERAKLILHPGTDKEEVIYDKGRNFYFITAMVISGFSNHKCVEVLAAAPSTQEGAKCPE